MSSVPSRAASRSAPGEPAHIAAPSLTPFVPTLFEVLGARVRDALGLYGAVVVTVRSRETRSPRAVVVTVDLPNGVSFELELAPTDGGRTGWRSAGGLELFVRGRVDALLADPTTGPSLTAIGQLFVRRQRLTEGTDAPGIWSELDRLAPWLGLDDGCYRRVFNGSLGRSGNLRLGYRCNQDCGLCWQSRGWPEPPAALYAVWLDELAAAGVTTLTFTGGEPTLHRSLPALVRRARVEHGMHVQIQTNAIQLAKPRVLDRLLEAGPHQLFVSLHAPEAALSDRITRAPGTHVRTVKGIESALAAGVPVGLNCVVDQLNVDALEAHGRFIVERFVRPFPDNPVGSVTFSRSQTYFDRALWQTRLVPMDRVRPGIVAAARLLHAHGVMLDITFSSCSLPACVLHEVPELVRLPAAEDVGQTDLRRTHHAPDSGCARCALAPRCEGPGHGYAERFGDRGLQPFAQVPPTLGAVARVP